MQTQALRVNLGTACFWQATMVLSSGQVLCMCQGLQNSHISELYVTSCLTWRL
jgi:hypothetical protein